MGKLIKTQDIDEFSEIITIPDKAIVKTIILNVRKLDEEKDFERAIKEILYDPNETPHGPTEIADIITSLHIHGVKKNAAFVLKSKSYPKVSSKLVSHQLLKLRQISDLGLAVFAAVGNIQDDAKRDFIQTAKDIGCDYLILNAHDVARLLIAYEKICAKDGMIYDQSGTCQNGHALDNGVTLEIELKEKYRFTITQQRDVSHGGAKRYSAVILTDRHYQKDILRKIIIDATEKLKFSNYYRNERVKARWGKLPSNVVWLDIAYDLNDISNSNWVCNTSWIDPNLTESMRPLPVVGTEQINGITISWNESYKLNKDFYEGHSGSKEDFLNGIRPILKEMKNLAELSIKKFTEYKQGNLSEGEYIKFMQRLCPQYDELYSDSGKLPLPPDDCKDYDQACQNIFATIHDISLYYSKMGLETWPKKNREWLMQNTIKRYQEELRKLDFEESKIH